MNDKSIDKSLLAGNLSGLTTYQAGVAQAATHRTLQKYCDDVLQQYGITKMQWLMIGTILDAGPNGIRLTDLSDKLGTTMAYITTAINLLESRGMVRRTNNDKDARSKYICIDSDFAPKCAEIEDVLRDSLRKTIYADIDPQEFRIYMKVLFQLGMVKPSK